MCLKKFTKCLKGLIYEYRGVHNCFLPVLRCEFSSIIKFYLSLRS